MADERRRGSPGGAGHVTAGGDGPADPPAPGRAAEGRDLDGRGRRPAGPTRREALRGIRGELEAGGIDGAGVEAERLLSHLLGVPRAELLTEGRERLGPGEAGRLARLVQRRLSGEPLQHIEGTVAFRDLVLTADARALIPRPETEQLVDRVASWIAERAPLPLALDVGTGSGAIALSLVTEGWVRRCIGIDVSPEALRQAAENRDRAGLDEAAVELRLAGRTFGDALRPDERFPLVVSNPPYVTEAELDSLPTDVREREPRVALLGGAEGLDVIREIVGGAPERLEPGGALFLEVGAGQARAVRELLEEAGWAARVEVSRDLAGRERFVRAIRDADPRG